MKTSPHIHQTARLRFTRIFLFFSLLFFCLFVLFRDVKLKTDFSFGASRPVVTIDQSVTENPYSCFMHSNPTKTSLCSFQVRDKH